MLLQLITNLNKIMYEEKCQLGFSNFQTNNNFFFGQPTS